MEPSAPTSIESSATPRTRRRLSFSLESAEQALDDRNEYVPAHPYSTRYSERVRRHRPTTEREDEPASALRSLGRPSDRDDSASASKAQRRVHFDTTTSHASPSESGDAGLLALSIYAARAGRLFSASLFRFVWPIGHRPRYSLSSHGRLWRAKASARRSPSFRRWFVLLLWTALLFLLMGKFIIGSLLCSKAWSASHRAQCLTQMLSTRNAVRTKRVALANVLGRSSDILERCYGTFSRMGRRVRSLPLRVIGRAAHALKWAVLHLCQKLWIQLRDTAAFHVIGWGKLWNRWLHPFRVWNGASWAYIWQRHHLPTELDADWHRLANRVERVEELLSQWASTHENGTIQLVDVTDPGSLAHAGSADNRPAAQLFGTKNGFHHSKRERSVREQEHSRMFVTELRDLHRALENAQVDTAKMIRSLENRIDRLEARMLQARTGMDDLDWPTGDASDYALAAAGARIIAARPSHGMMLARHIGRRLLCTVERAFRSASLSQCHLSLPYSPAIILQSCDLSRPLVRGRCWNAEHVSPSVTIQLSEPIRLKTVTLLYSPGRPRSPSIDRGMLPAIHVELEALSRSGSKAARLATATLAPSDCVERDRMYFCKAAVAADPKLCAEPLSMIRVILRGTNTTTKVRKIEEKSIGTERSLQHTGVIRLCLYKLAVQGEPPYDSAHGRPA